MFRILSIFTSSIARSATRRYLIYLEADFEIFFRLAGATRCTDGGESWYGGGDRRTLLRAKSVPSSVRNFTPIGATTRV